LANDPKLSLEDSRLDVFFQGQEKELS